MSRLTYPNLEAEMSRAGITRGDLADKLGLHVSGVYLMLNGKREISVSRAKQIRDTFFPSFRIDYLFGDSDERDRM